MEGLIQWHQQIPPFTRYWLALILVCGALTRMALVPRMSLLLAPAKAWYQPWRIITSFCYFGDLSLELVIGTLFRMKFNAEAERSFVTGRGHLPRYLHNLSKSEDAALSSYLDQYKLFDWFYFVLQVAATFVALAYYEYYQHGMLVFALGILLDDVLVFIWCHQNPDAFVNIIGLFNISTANVPLCTILFRWVQSDQFSEDAAKIISGNNLTTLSIFRSPLAWRFLLVLAVLHLWWFVRECWLGQINYDGNDSRRLSIHELRTRYGVGPSWTFAELVRYLVSPPWYWFIASRIKCIARESDLADERAHEVDRLQRLDDEARDQRLGADEINDSEDLDGNDQFEYEEI